MEPASRNACAIYMSVPLATSSMSKTCIKASAMLLMINSTAQAYLTFRDGDICQSFRKGIFFISPCQDRPGCHREMWGR